MPHQQQRLVAHVGRAVMSRIDPNRTLQIAAIAAAQHKWFASRRLEKVNHSHSRRRLACSAQGEIADANHGNPGAAACLGHPRPTQRAVRGSEW
jgi:hypothetical protein